MFTFLLSLLFLIVFSVSCQTIHYTNKAEVPAHYSHTQWHHIGLLGLLEFSPPVNVKARCGNKGWKAVRTQRNILQTVAGVVASAIASRILEMVHPILGPFSSVYTPEEASVSCKSS